MIIDWWPVVHLQLLRSCHTLLRSRWHRSLLIVVPVAVFVVARKKADGVPLEMRAAHCKFIKWNL